MEPSEEIALLRIRVATAERRLEHNRCNAGHETLPLKLWDCPECVRIQRLDLERQLHEAKQREKDDEQIIADLRSRLGIATGEES